MKLKFNITVPVYYVEQEDILPYDEQDAINITNRKSFITSSKRYEPENGIYQVFLIENNNEDEDPLTWLLEIRDLKNGTVQVTPMYEVELLKSLHNQYPFYKIKMKA